MKTFLALGNYRTKVDFCIEMIYNIYIKVNEVIYMNSVIYKKILENGNVITTKEVMELGFSKTLLTKYVQKGILERIGHGIYSFVGGMIDDMYIFSLRSDKIIFSHETALFLNGLSERTPFRHSVTIASNVSMSAEMREECECYYVKPELHSLGVIERKTTFGNIVRCYNLERTICDVLRNRNRLNEETVIGALKKYVASAEKDLNLLADYADKLRVRKILKTYLEVML